MADMSVQEIMERLGLTPHPKEGGFFRETYRSEESCQVLPPRYTRGTRSISTAIYYLLTPETCSRIHRLKSDEIFHFYLGDPVLMLQLMPDGTSREVVLGSDITKGFELQVIVPQSVWQGACLVPGGRFALLGTTVAPGFDYEDYEEGDRESLLQSYPERQELISRLTI